MSKDNKFPTSHQLNKWEREMKAAGLWPEKIQTINFKNPKIKPRKLGAVANAALVKPVTQDQGRQVKDMVAGHKRHWTKAV
jgi:hypothetical protein